MDQIFSTMKQPPLRYCHSPAHLLVWPPQWFLIFPTTRHPPDHPTEQLLFVGFLHLFCKIPTLPGLVTSQFPLQDAPLPGKVLESSCRPQHLLARRVLPTISTLGLCTSVVLGTGTIGKRETSVF